MHLYPRDVRRRIIFLFRFFFRLYACMPPHISAFIYLFVRLYRGGSLWHSLSQSVSGIYSLLFYTSDSRVAIMVNRQIVFNVNLAYWLVGFSNAKVSKMVQMTYKESSKQTLRNFTRASSKRYWKSWVAKLSNSWDLLISGGTNLHSIDFKNIRLVSQWHANYLHCLPIETDMY